MAVKAAHRQGVEKRGRDKETKAVSHPLGGALWHQKLEGQRHSDYGSPRVEVEARQVCVFKGCFFTKRRKQWEGFLLG